MATSAEARAPEAQPAPSAGWAVAGRGGDITRKGRDRREPGRVAPARRGPEPGPWRRRRRRRAPIVGALSWRRRRRRRRRPSGAAGAACCAVVTWRPRRWAAATTQCATAAPPRCECYANSDTAPCAGRSCARCVAPAGSRDRGAGGGHWAQQDTAALSGPGTRRPEGDFTFLMSGCRPGGAGFPKKGLTGHSGRGPDCEAYCGASGAGRQGVTELSPRGRDPCGGQSLGTFLLRPGNSCRATGMDMKRARTPRLASL